MRCGDLADDLLSICLLPSPGFYDRRRVWLYDDSTDGDRATRGARGPECTVWVITTVPPPVCIYICSRCFRGRRGYL